MLGLKITEPMLPLGLLTLEEGGALWRQCNSYVAVPTPSLRHIISKTETSVLAMYLNEKRRAYDFMQVHTAASAKMYGIFSTKEHSTKSIPFV